MSEARITGAHLMLAFLGGAATGAAVALLTAPAPGRETRHRLVDYTREGAQRTARVPQALKSASHAAKEAFSDSLHEEAEEALTS